MFRYRISGGAGAVLAVCLATAGPASAQAWIGNVVGQVAAQQAAAAAEAACQQGVPAPAADIERARADSDALLTGYFDLDSKAKPAALKKVFVLKPGILSYADVDGQAEFGKLGPRLDAPTPTVARLSFIVAGDAQSARGVWEARSGEQVIGYYAIDFQQTGVWGAKWRIWRITLFPADRQPTAAGAYCHYDPGTAWSLDAQPE